jgi:hypothetical protein
MSSSKTRRVSRACTPDRLRFPPEQQLTSDQPSLDGFAQPGVVGDEKIHSRQAKCFPQRLHLVGVDLDACTKRRLKEVGVGCRDAVPTKRVQKRCKHLRPVEAARCKVIPAFVLEDQPIRLVIPEDVKRLSLCVIVGAGQANNR